MDKFAISTDSNSDFYTDEVEKYGLYIGRLKYTITDKSGDINEYVDDFKSYQDYVDFYNTLRNGAWQKHAF